MNEQAIAVLFSGDPETGASSMDVFRADDETTSTLDPYHRAAALRDALVADFPTRMWAISVNEEATRLMRNTRMRAMGFAGPNYPQYAAAAVAADPADTGR